MSKLDNYESEDHRLQYFKIKKLVKLSFRGHFKKYIVQKATVREYTRRRNPVENIHFLKSIRVYLSFFSLNAFSRLKVWLASVIKAWRFHATGCVGTEEKNVSCAFALSHFIIKI